MSIKKKLQKIDKQLSKLATFKWPQDSDQYWYITAEAKIDTDTWISKTEDKGAFSLANVYLKEADCLRARALYFKRAELLAELSLQE